MNRIRIPNLARFEAEVQAYEAQPQEYGKIVFYGDSGFTRWSEKYGNRPLEQDLPGKDGKPAVLNRGIGGSTSDELLYYYPRVVRPCKPRALVYMTYANDFYHGYSAEDALDLQTRIFEYARRDMPGIRIYACDKRPIVKSLGELVPWGAYIRRTLEFNELLADYCAKHEDVTLVRHIDSPLFFHDPQDAGSYEKVRQDIFIEDQVHFNQKGYDLYAEFFRGILHDIL